MIGLGLYQRCELSDYDPILSIFLLRMHETAIFPLPILNPTSSSCFATQFSYKAQKFRRFGHK